MPRFTQLSHAAKFHLAVGIGVTAVVAALVFQKSRAATTTAPAPAPAALATWCAPGFEPLAGDACLAMPPRRDARAPVPLIVYLHGRYAQPGVDEELARQDRLARMAGARGYAVLALRGKRGQCTDPTLADWWCWPSNERNAVDGPQFVAAWSPALAAAEGRVGRGRRLLLGFSNGGYFATLIATRALVPFDAVVVAHAGPVAPTAAAGAKVPILLVTADDDPSNDEMLRLSSELTAARWPHDIVAREGGHELPERDVEWALAFFDRTRTEKVPLAPPLSTRAPRRREPDAGDDAAVAEPRDAGDAPAPTAEPTQAPSAAPAPSSPPPEEAP